MVSDHIIRGLSSIWQEFELKHLFDPDLVADKAIPGPSRISNYVFYGGEPFSYQKPINTKPFVQLAQKLYKLFYDSSFPIEQCKVCDTPLMTQPYHPDGHYMYCPHCWFSAGYNSDDKNRITCSWERLYEVEASNIRLERAFSVFVVFLVENSKIYNSTLHTMESLEHWNELAELRVKAIESILSDSLSLTTWKERREISVETKTELRHINSLIKDLVRLRTLGQAVGQKAVKANPVCSNCGNAPSYYEGPFIEFVPCKEVLQIRVLAKYSCYGCRESQEGFKWTEIYGVLNIIAECDHAHYSDLGFISFTKNERENINLHMKCKCSRQSHSEELRIFEIDKFLSRIMSRYHDGWSGGSYFPSSINFTLPVFNNLEKLVLLAEGIRFRISTPEHWLLHRAHRLPDPL